MKSDTVTALVPQKFTIEDAKKTFKKLWEQTEYLPNGERATEKQRLTWFKRFFLSAPMKHKESFYASWEAIGKARYNGKE